MQCWPFVTVWHNDARMLIIKEVLHKRIKVTVWSSLLTCISMYYVSLINNSSPCLAVRTDHTHQTVRDNSESFLCNRLGIYPFFNKWQVNINAKWVKTSEALSGHRWLTVLQHYDTACKCLACKEIIYWNILWSVSGFNNE